MLKVDQVIKKENKLITKEQEATKTLNYMKKNFTQE